MKILKIIGTVFMVALCSQSAFAIQEFSVKDGDTITVKLSSRELTHISIEGGRISRIFDKAGSLDVQPDKVLGDGFITPRAGTQPVFSFFVRDDMGSTYTIVAQQADIPSETIVLKPQQRRKATANGSENGTAPFVESIKRLIKAMALDEAISGYIVNETKDDVALWKETKITLVKTYRGDMFNGEAYQLKNISNDKMVLSENDFLDFGAHVQAVGIEALNLEKGQSTIVYVVRLREAN